MATGVPDPLSTRRYVPDQWGPLSHKAVMGIAEDPVISLAPSWSGRHARRLTAYVIYQSYLDNNSRHFMGTNDLEVAEEHREYGDAWMVRAQIRAALLGDSQDIVVDGAADFDPDLEPVDPNAEGEQITGPDGRPLLGPDNQPLRRPVEGPSAEELADNEEARIAAEREDWLREWADRVQFTAQMVETEDSAVGLGDGTYVLGWSERNKRVTLDTYEPDCYFPVLTDGPSGDYPRRVHVAWEVLTDRADTPLNDDEQPTDGTKRQVRRLTWELGPIVLGLGLDGAPTGEFVDTADMWVHRDPDTRRIVEGIGPEGTETMVGRWYPWQLDAETGQPLDGEEPSTETCYMTDALWELTNLRAPSPDDFTEATVHYQANEDGVALNRLDLRFDFVPVVHVPNTVARRDHFGRSSLASIVQLLDDLQTADSDVVAAGATTGAPPIFSTEMMHADTAGRVISYGPGQVYPLGPDGKVEVVDTSGGVTALMALVSHLLDRLSVNLRVPAAVLGRVKPNEVPSGVALLLSFSPMASMIGEMRLPRAEKYPLLLKFVQRLSQVGGAGRDGIGLPHGPTLEAWVAFGSFLPSDRTAVVEQVNQLRTAGVASRETCIRILIEAGFSIDDAAEELRRIEQEDFAGAVQLLDATGNEQAVGDYLGVDIVRPPAPPPAPTPAPTPPGGGGGAPPGPPRPSVPPTALPTPQATA